MKKFFLSTLGVVLVIGLVYWILLPHFPNIEQTKNVITESVEEGAIVPPRTEDIAALAVKDIDLRQGEGGVQLWRLVAEWGTLRQEDSILLLSQPHFSYRMDDGVPLTVRSEKGDINQDEQIVRFMDSVEARYEESLLETAVMVYDGNLRSLTLPEPAVFTSPGVEMTARRVVWSLDEQLLTGEGGVSVYWEREFSTNNEGEQAGGDAANG